MSKILEKSLKDARKEDRLTMGSKQVLNSMKNSKLIVLSQSVKKEMFYFISHYEKITKWMFKKLTHEADLVLKINQKQEIIKSKFNSN